MFGSKGSIRKSKRKIATSNLVLGISVTTRTVYATLLQRKGESISVLRQFTRQRSSPLQTAEPAKSPAAATPASAGVGEDDVSFRFEEDAPDLSNLFLQSEFESAEDESGTPEASDQKDASLAHPSTFVLELQDILSECRDIGYDNPALAFCLGTPDVNYVTLERSVTNATSRKARKADKKEAADAGSGKVAESEQRLERGDLLEWLTRSYSEPFDEARAEFIRMAGDASEIRYLAVVPELQEPVIPTLELISADDDAQTPSTQLLDSEVSLYLGMARSCISLGPEDYTAIVRIGTSDTLVMLLEGEALIHEEHLHSLTTFDRAETICSRVLLQQDELEIGHIHNVIVIAEERGEDLFNGFETFYPDSKVVGMEEGLKEIQIHFPEGEDQFQSGAMVAAAGAAYRVIVGTSGPGGLFEPINMLPVRMSTRRRVNVAVGWHTVVVGALLFFVVLFFVARFHNQQRAIGEYQRVIETYPPEVEMTAGQLEMRIDSLQNAYQSYTRALAVLDTLLIGTDRWTRILEKTSSEAAQVTGVWIDSWQPQGNQIRIQGNATTRDRVVQFAERMTGSIELLTFSEIREWPVYHYSMVIHVPNEIPLATEYLRAQAVQESENFNGSN